MTVARTEWLEYRYHPVDEHWQRQACTSLGLRFIRPFQYMSGRPGVILTRPDNTSLRNIGGDRNCLFRALCYIITGSEAQHYVLRSDLIMLSIPVMLCGMEQMVTKINWKNMVVMSVKIISQKPVWLLMVHGH